MKQHLASLALVLVTAGCVGEADIDPQGVNDENIGSNASALGGTFFDGFDSFSSSRWTQVDGANGAYIFGCGWKPDHISYSGGFMTLRLDSVDSYGKPYTSGELRSNTTYGYGKFETRMKPVRRSGVISTFFTYAGSPHDEIDIEFLGDDTTRVQFNYFKNDVGGHEKIHDLGFDASAAYHNYAIVWSPTSITWEIDSVAVYSVTGTTSTLPSTPGKIMMNLWNTRGADGWAGSFSYPGPLTAGYDWAQYFAL